MGDILHALPAVTALRRMHPMWRIDWVVEPRWRSLLVSEDSAAWVANDEVSSQRKPGRPVVDAVIEADTRGWRRDGASLATARAIRQLRTTLRTGEYDAVLEMQGAIRTAVIARFPGCRRVIGDAHPRERQARWLYTEPVAAQGAHVIDRGLELAEAVAADPLEMHMPDLPVDSAAEAWCEQLLDDWKRLDGSIGDAPFVLIHPGAGWGAKRWPTERFHAVAEWLGAQGVSALVNAGPGEEPLAEAVVRDLPAARAVRSSLAQLTALTRRAGLVIGGDTGPLHLACALGRPVVGIYGPTDPARNGPYRFPGGAECAVLRSAESRRDHRRLPEPEAGLLKIDSQAVCREAARLLELGYNQQG